MTLPYGVRENVAGRCVRCSLLSLQTHCTPDSTGPSVLHLSQLSQNIGQHLAAFNSSQEDGCLCRIPAGSRQGHSDTPSGAGAAQRRRRYDQSASDIPSCTTDAPIGLPAGGSKLRPAPAEHCHPADLPSSTSYPLPSNVRPFTVHRLMFTFQWLSSNVHRPPSTAPHRSPSTV